MLYFVKSSQDYFSTSRYSDSEKERVEKVQIILLNHPGPALESKGMQVIFQKKEGKGQKNVKKGKKGKIFENFGKNVQYLKIC